MLATDERDRIKGRLALKSAYIYARRGYSFVLSTGSFINVHIQGNETPVPYDMYEIPDWVNRTAVDEDVFVQLCLLYLANRGS